MRIYRYDGRAPVICWGLRRPCQHRFQPTLLIRCEGRYIALIVWNGGLSVVNASLQRCIVHLFGLGKREMTLCSPPKRDSTFETPPSSCLPLHLPPYALWVKEHQNTCHLLRQSIEYPLPRWLLIIMWRCDMFSTMVIFSPSSFLRLDSFVILFW